MHICPGNLTIIGSENDLLLDQHQAIILINAGMLLIGPRRTNFSGILIEILTFVFKKMCLKVSSAKWQPFYLNLNMLMYHSMYSTITAMKCLFFPCYWCITIITSIMFHQIYANGYIHMNYFQLWAHFTNDLSLTIQTEMQIKFDLVYQICTYHNSCTFRT